MLEAQLKKVTAQDERLFAKVLQKLGPWRKFLIGIDGKDDSGKSTLGRLLAWHLEMPTIETDLFLVPNERDEIVYRYDDMKRLIERRMNDNRPVIVEGIILLEILRNIGLEPDYFIYVTSPASEDSQIWQSNFTEYEAEFAPAENADFKYNRFELS